MSDTYTPHYNFVQPSVGGDPDTWGDLLNSNFGAIDTAIWNAAQAADAAQAAVGTALPLAGGTLTGPLTLAADPAGPLQASTKQYVDAVGASGLKLTGGTLTGPVSLHFASPTLMLDAAASGQGRFIIGRSPTGLNRWAILPGDTSTETAGNIGSNFAVQRFDDAGNYIDAPLTIARASGQVMMAKRPSWAGFTPYDTGNFNPGAYQPAGSYARNADAHAYSFAWSGSGVELIVDGTYYGTAWTNYNLNPASYQTAGNYVTGNGVNLSLGWNNGLLCYVNGSYVGVIYPSA